MLTLIPQLCLAAGVPMVWLRMLDDRLLDERLVGGRPVFSPLQAIPVT